MTTSTVPYALAVDDDPIILMDICGILEDAGFRCHSVDDGDAAKDMLPEHAEGITLLFSDVEMPGDTDGFALARHVAEDGRISKLSSPAAALNQTMAICRKRRRSSANRSRRR